MLSASLKMVVFLLALVAGGFAMHDAASASQMSAPCHAIVVGSDTADQTSSTLERDGVETAAAAEASQAHHRHGSGRGCPTGGSCCDAFCHAVMTVSLSGAGAVDVTFASYVRSDDEPAGSLSLLGPERPPRTATI